MADDEEPEDEDELQAVAKHFGKDIEELTLEALIKLEQRRTEEEEENEEEEEDVPKRKGPSLESILGTMPSAATLGLSESLNSCMGEEKENGECTLVFKVITGCLTFLFYAEQSDLVSHYQELD